ncbi:MAG: CAP domain-containing protein [Bacillota bacterium]|nr:CAP domain-containing protein [Bacillota bacterium]
MQQRRYRLRAAAIALAMLLLTACPASTVSRPGDAPAVLPSVSYVASDLLSIGNQTVRIRVEFTPLSQPSSTVPDEDASRILYFTINGKTYYLPFKVSLQLVGTPGTTPSTVPAPSVPTPAPVRAAAPSPAAVPAPSPSPAATAMTAEEQLMLALVNQERTKLGLSVLKPDMRLVLLARQKSQDMINKNYFSHTSSTYGSPFDMMRKAEITYRTAGENLAGSYSVESAHTALMRSDGHRRNILNPAFTHIGIGIVRGGTYGLMFTQMFIGL